MKRILRFDISGKFQTVAIAFSSSELGNDLPNRNWNFIFTLVLSLLLTIIWFGCYVLKLVYEMETTQEFISRGRIYDYFMGKT